MEQVNGYHWYGEVTIENIEAVAKTIEEVLTGKYYTFASLNADCVSIFDVHTSQKLEPDKATDKKALSVWFDKEHTPPQYAGFNFVDTYGVWGLSTGSDKPYISFKYNHQIRIEQLNGYGEKLIWIITTENHEQNHKNFNY